MESALYSIYALVVFVSEILLVRCAVRVKGGMSLRKGMWHGLRNDIIMRNVKYGNWRKEIN